MEVASPSSASLVGRHLGDFRIVDEIGHGGMGTAYLAEQQTLRREAVVKVIAAPDVPDEIKVRFLREARLASRLDHPYAAHVYAFGSEPDGVLWIAMELVRGTPLDRLIADQGPLPPARFVPFFDRLCEVVHSAHEQGIIHRDIKPANVMVVRRAGRMLPKLLDFGIARMAGLAGEPADSANLEPLAIPDSVLEVAGRSVTVRGVLVGTPHYMAPEQWHDATRANPRSDLYALAITAYEMLTGKPPFTGKTVLEIARGHARTPVPPVGGNLPQAFDHVFARALAKREAERYESVLDLANAIRAIGAARGEHPTDFDEVVRDTFFHDGPQPIAEALVELAAARDPTTAWQAGWRVVAVVTRVLAVIGLAARARVGERDRGTLARLLRNLVERGLDLEEWWAVIDKLTEKLANRAQAHPVPELVELCWGPDGARRPFDALKSMKDAPAETLDVDVVRHMLGELARLLRACSFLTDYAWVSAGGERWMGARRQPRERVATAIEAGMWLVDRDGVAILELSPLATVAPPALGADDELFLVDGPSRRGGRSVAWPREFERYDDRILEFLGEHLVELGDGRGDDERDVAPYLGLASFQAGDASMFFGREREVEGVVNRLRVQPSIAVVGPSGVGKSSFVHAGVVPALPETWQVLSLRPGVSPLDALEARLVGAGAARGLADRVAGDPAALDRALDELARRAGGTYLLVIDQLEEIFTQCRDVAVRDRFALALAAVETSRVVVTLRDDFLVRAAELPGFGPRLAGSLELVTLPDPITLRRILVEPLRRVGYAFETEAMPDDMVAAVREHPGALALLSFAAAKLWELRDKRFRHIPQRAYDASGGVVGALARHAEDTLSKLDAADHLLVRELFRHLVTSEGTRAALRRSEAIELLGKAWRADPDSPQATTESEAGDRSRAEHVIETLVESRLLVGYEGDGGTDWIEVVHEALLSAWPRLVTWQREDAEGARLRDQLRSAARQWRDRGRPKGLLWRGEALVEYRLWRVRHNAVLTDLESEFALASTADEARSRRLRRGALIVVVTGLVIGLVVLQRANRAAERNAAESRRVALASLVEQGRVALVSERPQDAMVYLSAAYTQGARDRNLAFMIGEAARALDGELLVLRGHAGTKSAVFTDDGARIVTAGNDNTVKIWDARSGALERSFAATGSLPYTSARLTASGDILTSGEAEAPAVWQLATATRRFELGGKGAFVDLSPDGALAVTLDYDGRMATWNTGDGSLRAETRLEGAMFPVYATRRIAAVVRGGIAVVPADLSQPPTIVKTRPFLFDMDRDGDRLVVTEDRSRHPTVFELARADAPPVVLTGHVGDVIRAMFSPDGTQIGTISMDRTAKLWSPDDGRLIASLDGHRGYVFALVWSPDGNRVATASVDGVVRLWDARTGAPLATLHGHRDLVMRLAFDAAGARLVSASLDGTARVFDLGTTRSSIALDQRTAIALRASGDGRRLIATGTDGAAWVIDASTRAVVTEIADYRKTDERNRLFQSSNPISADLDATGERVALPVGREVKLIALADRARPVVRGPLDAAVTSARFAPGGRVIAATDDGAIAIWNADGAIERALPPDNERVQDIAVHPSGLVATASKSGVAKLFRVGTTDPPLDIRTDVSEGLNGVAISPSGRLVATASTNDAVAIFDTSGGTLVAHAKTISELLAVAFIAEDRVAVANRDGFVTIYDSRDARLLAHHGDAASGWSSGLAFSPLDDTIASTDDRGLIRFWSVRGDTRPATDIARYVACHIPLQLVETQLVPAPIDRDCR